MTYVLTGICLVCAVWSALCAMVAMHYARQANAAKRATSLMLGVTMIEGLVNKVGGSFNPNDN